MRRATLLWSAAVLGWTTCAVADSPIFPIYEIPTPALPDVHDGSLDDWEAVVPGPSLTHNDFRPLAVQDGAGIDPADLAYRCFLGWHGGTQTIWIGVERVDDVYINTYPGGEPGNMWMHDGIEFMVDGDHSGGEYNGCLTNDACSEEEALLLAGYQAQQYTLIPESPDGTPISANASASGWVTHAPWSDAGGASWGGGPTITVTEGFVTPWDALDWHGPEVSTPSTLEAGRIIGFQISMPDFDVVGTYHAFHTIAGLANTWRMADNFVDGELIGCDEEGCSGGPVDSGVHPESWGRIKASLQ